MILSPTRLASAYNLAWARAVFGSLLLILGCSPGYAADEPKKSASTDKTFVAWVSPANLTQQGGSVLTVQNGLTFDAIVFGELTRGKWMAGSNMFERTQKDQKASTPEDVESGKFVQIAIVYEGSEIRIYRDGKPYTSYKAKNIDLLGTEKHIAIFGLRHLGTANGSPFSGTIEDARIYGQALSEKEIAALKPNEASEIKPLAWWDFEGEALKDRAGHFTHHKIVGDAKIENGKLHLSGKGHVIAALSEEDAVKSARGLSPGPAYVPETPKWPDQPPAKWLTFHLAHPGPGPAMPGDPNCIFDYKGKVHLHYIYRNRTGYVFGHVSSDDMVRWTWHKTVLAPPTTGHGMFSGTGFYTKEGKPAIIYHGQGSGKNVIQFPADDNFDSWTDPIAVIPKDNNDKVPNIRHWDPDCWLMDDQYYAYSGGQNPQLMKSSDLKKWTYLGDLLHKDYPAQLGIPRNEDISCGNMFKIGDKWMLLCISHGKGARYYLGDFKDEKYLPSYHAMMSFGSNQFFAPESVLTKDNRRVMWAWLMNMPIEPTGVQSLPRELELPADGVLRIRPLKELAKLRHDEKKRENITIKDGQTEKVAEAVGDAIEMEIEIASAALPPEFNISLLNDNDGKGGMSIVAGAGRKTLKVGTTEVPFQLAKDEDLKLRIFIDKNLVEVFANDRQAAVFAVKTHRAEPNITFSSKGGDATVKSLKAWKMHSIYVPEAPSK